MGWPSSLTYHEIAASNVARSVGILACYNDVHTAESVFAANPALADDPEALASAAASGHEAFVRLMLRYQPDLAQRIVLVARTRALTEFLFENGMDPSRPDWLRVTPLHRFAQQGDVEKAALFIDHGADLHARDEDICSTPLAWAAKFGRTRMVEFLLRRGARPSLPDDPPWATPLAWATRRGHDEIVRVLTAYERSGVVPARSLEHYETLASDLVEAYRSGHDPALRRIIDLFQIERMLTWDRRPHAERLTRLRRYVRERLGTRSDAATEGDTLTLADAHVLIARSHGFEAWSQLVTQVA